MDIMHQNQGASCNEMQGMLPACAPLATPYVPFQNDAAQTYQASAGFIRGTLYPGLDLPFMGMVNKNEKPVTPMTELQTMAFAIQELALYLDTHRNDHEAYDLYCTMKKMYRR